ncbi:MAG: ABC transporter ATP-binding protein [Myxococcales bacterium]|nr:ABC transporter ATP-binding protein [Myxococcales bacterium]USN50221.1 MAG: ABC transporter ATP-binding protein [Myxococcales bacterium]
MLHLSKIIHRFGKRYALNELSFSTADFGIVGILGANGSGKSTLLKILSGLLPCQSGKIELSGQTILDKRGRLKRTVRNITGALLQESSSDEKLSVLENMQFFARLMNLSPTLCNERIKYLIQKANLTQESQISVKKLSGGMRRRCELYRTFLHNPRLLFLDEPTTGLDFQENTRFFNFLKSYVEDNKALALFSSHNPDDFLHCDYLIMMHQGCVIAAHTPKQFLDKCRTSYVEIELKANGLENLKQSSGISFLWQKTKVEDQKIKTWLAPHELQQCFDTQALSSPAIKAFSLREANMADVYERLVKEQDNALL